MTVEKIILEAAENQRLRWIRAGVGGGFIGLLISATFVFVNDAVQLPWMASTIIVGSLLGALIELVAPWASGTKDQFLRLVEVLWPESTVISWRHEGITVYQYDIPGSIETELDRFRAFFDAIEKLDWKLSFEQDLNRSYKRNRVRMDINLEPLDHHVVMRLAVLRGIYASQASPNLSRPVSKNSVAELPE